MFRSASLFIGTSFTVAVFTIVATSNVNSIVGIPHKIYSVQRILIHIKSRSLCYVCLSAPRVCSKPGGQKPVLSLSLDRIVEIKLSRFGCYSENTKVWHPFLHGGHIQQNLNLKQGKSEGFESCDRPIARKRPIWVKIGDVLSRVTLKFDGWPWKTIGHLSFAVSSFVQHFIAIGEFQLELQSGNAQFGSNLTIFRAVWPWNLTYDLVKQ